MTRRKKPTTPPAPVTADALHQEMEIIAAAYAQSLNYSDTYRVNAEWFGAKYMAWLEEHGLTIEELKQVATRRHGLPVASPTLVAEFFRSYIASSDATATTLKARVPLIAAWFQINGWDVSEFQPGSNEASVLKRMAEAARIGGIEIKTQAKAFTPDDVELLIEACDTDTLVWPSLLREAMKTYMAVAFAMGFRPGELAYSVTWEMLDLDAEEFTLPGGVFKKQEDTYVLPLPHNHSDADDCAGTCPVALLHAWRTRCEDEGIPTSGATLIFPAIAVDFSYSAQRTAMAVSQDRLFQGRAWVADPVQDEIDRYGDKPEVRHFARKMQYRRYARHLARLAEIAGIEADWDRHASGHSFRRGMVTTAANNGAPIQAMQHRCRHKSPETTGIYTDRKPPDTTQLLALPHQEPIDPTDLEITNGTQTQLAFTCEVEHHGEVCGLRGQHRATINGTVLAVCATHGDRIYKELTGDELTKPVRPSRPGTTCEVEHDGAMCGLKKDGHFNIDDGYINGCMAHIKRQSEGKTGDDLTKPIRQRRRSTTSKAASCEITHPDGTVCGLERKLRRLTIGSETLTVCGSHYNRHVRGKEGDELTSPISKRA